MYGNLGVEELGRTVIQQLCLPSFGEMLEASVVTVLKSLRSLIHKGELTMMISGIEISSLSNQDLLALEQEILAEESRRVMNSSTAIVVEPDAPEKSHHDAIQRLLERKSQNP
jgi:hypothetical protein